MKVLWLTSSYPRTPDDSAAVFLRYLALALQREGIALHILAPDAPGIAPASSTVPLHTFRYFFPRHWQKLAYGAGILPNLRHHPGLYLQIPGFVAAMTAAAWRLCRRLHPALLHAHWIVPQGSVAVAIGRRLGIPTVVTAHGGDAFALRGKWLGRLKRWTLDHADAWTGNTRVTAAAAGGAKPAVVIPMGIDCDRFATADPGPLTREKGDDRVILFVGRLVEKKGVGDLLDAFARLEKSRPCRLWIVGDGTERLNLERRAERLGIRDRVRFWGRQPNAALPPFYAAADLFVAPSVTDRSGDTEGQGVVLLEAMASGTAVVATRTGGIGEVVEDGREGLLVEPGAPQQLSAAMTRLLQDDTLRRRLACAGRRKAAHYDWQVIGRRFAALYRRLVPGDVLESSASDR